jgi:hypothetical protein
MNCVHYDDDDDMLITCNGNDDDLSSAEEVHVVGLGHLIARDPTLLDIPELYSGAWAERSESDRRWRVFNNNNQ